MAKRKRDSLPSAGLRGVVQGPRIRLLPLLCDVSQVAAMSLTACAQPTGVVHAASTWIRIPDTETESELHDADLHGQNS